MKYVLMFVSIALLSGCALDPEYRAARERERIAKYTAKCESFGFKKETAEMNQCILKMFEIDNNAAAAYGAAIIGQPKSNTTCRTSGNTTTCY